jgi:hypothetical protein
MEEREPPAVISSSDLLRSACPGFTPTQAAVLSSEGRLVVVAVKNGLGIGETLMLMLGSDKACCHGEGNRGDSPECRCSPNMAGRMCSLCYRLRLEGVQLSYGPSLYEIYYAL